MNNENKLKFLPAEIEIHSLIVDVIVTSLVTGTDPTIDNDGNGTDWGEFWP